MRVHNSKAEALKGLLMTVKPELMGYEGDPYCVLIANVSGRWVTHVRFSLTDAGLEQKVDVLPLDDWHSDGYDLHWLGCPMPTNEQVRDFLETHFGVRWQTIHRTEADDFKWAGKPERKSKFVSFTDDAGDLFGCREEGSCDF